MAFVETSFARIGTASASEEFRAALAGPTPARSPCLIPVSVVIPALNDQERIADAVSDAVKWADEIIVIDGGSQDDTVARAEAAGATVHVVPDCTIGGQRNFGASIARNDWVFALDTDKRA